ncbi:MAG TPA: hypothetical protein H9914_09360, partial [Candidatus Blautia avicola]|nr:hypothetical protein [Candidatus Blautia avicola]
MRENVRCEIYCQKGKSFYPEITLNTEGREEEGLYVEMAEHMTKDCCLGEICLRIKNTSNMENFNLRAGRPVKIYLPMEQPEKMTAMYMFNPWWTRP